MTEFIICYNKDTGKKNYFIDFFSLNSNFNFREFRKFCFKMLYGLSHIQCQQNLTDIILTVNLFKMRYVDALVCGKEKKNLKTPSSSDLHITKWDVLYLMLMKDILVRRLHISAYIIIRFFTPANYSNKIFYIT